MLKLNEGRVCDAIVRHLEVRTGVSRADVRTHDRHPDQGKRIELTFRLGNELIAVEHTAIEPFSGFIRLNAEAERHFDPITTAAGHAVPQGSCVELQVPVGAMGGLRSKEISRIQDEMVKFIIDAAPRLPMRRYKDHRVAGPIAVPGIPFTFRLHRYESSGIMPPLVVVHTARDLEKSRAERLREACDKKFPKLARWKAENKARTILVLEENDIQLTNSLVVAEAFLPIARSRDDVPDETYMVFTGVDTWYLSPILIDGASYFDLSESDQPIHTEIDPKTLAAVTGR